MVSDCTVQKTFFLGIIDFLLVSGVPVAQAVQFPQDGGEASARKPEGQGRFAFSSSKYCLLLWKERLGQEN